MNANKINKTQTSADTKGVTLMYVVLTASGERLYQYPATEYIDVAERYRRDYLNKTGKACRIATRP